MSQELIHVYLMPGMAASSSIFEYIKLPEEQFKIHLLEWLIPNQRESMEDYAMRMSQNVKHTNCVLIGVSFGGILVQEMRKFLKVSKLIIVSSVKSREEFPKRIKVVRKTRAYKLIPTRLVGNIELLAKYAFGETIPKRIKLYKKYLAMNDRRYLDWAIREMVCWNQTEYDADIIHIHGNKDAVFPIGNVKGCLEVIGGSHIMIINKYKWFNENLPKLILR